MKNILIAIFLLSASISNAQSKDENSVRDILDHQTAAWNRGDIPGFMNGYWQNDSLMFIGKTDVTYGWTNTLNHYKKSYPDTITMGKLDFTLIDVKRLSGEYYHVVGKWHLHRSVGDLSGHFTLLFRKFGDHWYIIADHSS